MGTVRPYRWYEDIDTALELGGVHVIVYMEVLTRCV